MQHRGTEVRIELEPRMRHRSGYVTRQAVLMKKPEAETAPMLPWCMDAIRYDHIDPQMRSGEQTLLRLLACASFIEITADRSTANSRSISVATRKRSTGCGIGNSLALRDRDQDVERLSASCPEWARSGAEGHRV